MEKLVPQSVGAVLLYTPVQLWGDIASVCSAWNVAIKRGKRALIQSMRVIDAGIYIPSSHNRGLTLAIRGSVLLGLCITPASYKHYHKIKRPARIRMAAERVQQHVLKILTPVKIHGLKELDRYYYISATDVCNVLQIDIFQRYHDEESHMYATRLYITLNVAGQHLETWNVRTHVEYFDAPAPDDMTTLSSDDIDSLDINNHSYSVATFHPDGHVKSYIYYNNGGAKARHQFNWTKDGGLISDTTDDNAYRSYEAGDIVRGIQNDLWELKPIFPLIFFN